MAQAVRVTVWALLTSAQTIWRRQISQIVPGPYLDEVFHIPQALAYWSGDWRKWNPKITTPPGLYVVSYALGHVQTLLQVDLGRFTDCLRMHNAILWFMLAGVLYCWRKIDNRYRSGRNQEGSEAAKAEDDSALPRELVMVMFPLLFFFSGLYYTDLLSVLSVVITFTIWTLERQLAERGSPLRILSQFMFIASGLFSLTVRQTNIFWVAIYLGGLQTVEGIKKRVGAKRVHDPPIADGYFEDLFFITPISLVQSVGPIIPNLVVGLWPQMVLLASFASFVKWNGGVVLGDKSNHIVTLNLPQMLYIWPFMLFFSWPMVLPYLTTPPGSTQPLILQNLPRLLVMGIFTTFAIGIICLNTVVHSFTLADNRHYIFYVFRYFILPYGGLIRYALSPVYIVSGWLVIMTLGGVEKTPSPRADSGQVTTSRKIRISWLAIWLVSTAGSLITAPLVEPRYFMIPWLVWRLHVPYCSLAVDSSTAPKKGGAGSGKNGVISKVVNVLAAYSNWVELAWYGIINVVAGYVFLYRGFTWPQEPGKVQRFMW